jgi:FkbM family methyltransferase
MTRTTALPAVPGSAALGRLPPSQLLLRSLMALPPAWGLFERTLVRLRHRFPTSRRLAALSAAWLEAMRRWRPDELTRVAVLPGGARLAIVLSDGWHRGIYFRGDYEPETTRLVRSSLLPGDVFLDVGANIGYYACLAASRGAVAHAFEPHPDLVERMELTRTLNRFGDRLRIVPAAVAERDGTARFFLSPQAINCGLSSLLPLPHLQSGRQLDVATLSLDSYCRQQGIRRIRLLKIDVEGAELQVLAGAHMVLHALRPDAIICELGGFREGSRPADVLRQFAAAGYRPYEITATGLVPMAAAPERSDQDWPQRNCCFLPVEQPASTAMPAVPEQPAWAEDGAAELEPELAMAGPGE